MRSGTATFPIKTASRWLEGVAVVFARTHDTDLEVTDPSLDLAFSTIARRVVPGATLVHHRRLEGGVSAAVYGLEVSSESGIQRFVIRRHGAAAWKQLSGDVTRAEFELLVALQGAGLPVPRPFLLDVSAELLPSPFFVMSMVEGSTDISDSWLDSALRQMAEFLARLHSLDVNALRLPCLPLRDDPVQGALESLAPGAGPAHLRELVSS